MIQPSTLDFLSTNEKRVEDVSKSGRRTFQNFPPVCALSVRKMQNHLFYEGRVGGEGG